MNVTKRVFALCLAALMLVTQVPTTAFAQTDACSTPEVCADGVHKEGCDLYSTESQPEEKEACETDGCELDKGHEGNHSNFVPCDTEGCTYAKDHGGNHSNFVQCDTEGCTYAKDHEGYHSNHVFCDGSQDCQAASHDEGCVAPLWAEFLRLVAGLPSVEEARTMTAVEKADAYTAFLAVSDYADENHLTPTGDQETYLAELNTELSKPALTDWDGEDVDTNWYDENTNSFTMTTAAQLAGLAELVNKGTTFSGKTVTLGADINLNNHPWVGIGVYNKLEAGTAFRGTFDGGNHKISGVTFADNGSDKNNYRGFFNQLYNSTVQNLTVEGNGFGTTPPSGEYGGAMIAGHARSSTIENCIAEGSISGTHNVGGIVVRISTDANRTSLIKNCTNKANLTGSYTKLGGIAALSQSIETPFTIEGCINEGSISSTASGTDGVGGIIGWVGYLGQGDAYDMPITIKSCENKGTITGTDTAKMGQIAGLVTTKYVIEGTNKGKTNMLAIEDAQVGGLNFATVENGIATYTATLTAGNTYLVTAKGTKPAITLAAGESITFDTSLTTFDDSGITADGYVAKSENGNLVTYTAMAAKIGGQFYTTLQAAIDAAQSGSEVTLLTNATGELNVPESITLNLDNFTLTGTITIAHGKHLTLRGTSTTNAITLETPSQDHYNTTWHSATPMTSENQLASVANITTVTETGTAYYHQWVPVAYAITYAGIDGTTIDGTNPTSYTIESAKITLTNPTKTGYTFTGWSGTGLDSTSTTVEIPTGSTGDRTYTANWTPTAYTITYAGMVGATADPANPTSYNIESAKITLTTPTKTGYTFTGWSGTGLDSTSTTVEIPTGSTGNRTYTANWSPNAYTINYEGMDGATHGDNAPTTHTYGTATTLVAPTKSGANFLGWYTDAAFTESAKVESLSATGYTATITLYAKWVVPENPVITLTADKATSTYGEAVILTATVKGPSNAALTQTGADTVNFYTLKADGTRTPISSVKLTENGTARLQLSQMTAGSHTFYAEYAGSAYYNSATAQVTITVNKATGSVTFPNAEVYKIVGDTSFRLLPTTSEDGTITYSSSNEAVATVDSTGKVTVKSDGTATITASAVFSNYQNAEGSYKLTVVPKDNYKITEGNQQTVTQGEKARFRSNASFSKFKEVRLNGNVVDPDNYEVKEGSTIVTLKASYVKTLTAGTYTLTIVSEDGSASTTFAVKKASSSSSDDDDTDYDDDNYKTGDTTNTGVWLAIALIGLVGVLVSLLGKKYLIKLK